MGPDRQILHDGHHRNGGGGRDIRLMHQLEAFSDGILLSVKFPGVEADKTAVLGLVRRFVLLPGHNPGLEDFKKAGSDSSKFIVMGPVLDKNGCLAEGGRRRFRKCQNLVGESDLQESFAVQDALLCWR
ncbi:MAG: hypothetical protein R2751_16860 [Bacteroidales bacterium]